MLKVLLAASAATSIYYFGSQIAKNAASKIWELISFSVPSGKTNVKIGLSSILVTSAIKIANQNRITVQIGGLHAIAKYKDKEGNLVEIGRTEPNSKVWTIAAQASTIIENIQIKAGTLGTIQALISALQKKEGERLLIVFSGTVNGLPLQFEYWY